MIVCPGHDWTCEAVNGGLVWVCKLCGANFDTVASPIGITPDAPTVVDNTPRCGTCKRELCETLDSHFGEPDGLCKYCREKKR